MATCCPVGRTQVFLNIHTTYRNDGTTNFDLENWFLVEDGVEPSPYDYAGHMQPKYKRVLACPGCGAKP